MDLFISAEISKAKKLIYKNQLLPINNLKLIFREIRDYFAGNVTGITRDEKIAQNIMRLLFCKIYDEKYTQNEQLVSFANRPNEDLEVFEKRIFTLFEQVKNQYADIFEIDEILEIPAFDLSFIVSKMEDFYILNADRDIIADAFEELIGTSFRGGEGQFFTPRNIVQMMIDVLQPQSGERIIDPACGSGGFIAHILQHLIKNKASNYFISGIDKDLFLSKLAKIYLTILGENEYNIFCENSLENPTLWKPETQNHIQLNSFDLILANPPFGAKIPVIGESLLKQYELGHFWQENQTPDMRDNQAKYFITKALREKQPPQILFIERIIQLLKAGGRAGIILPEGVFGNPSDRYVWEYIKKYASIMGVVSLSQETFQPSTHTKTSVVFLEKKIQNRSNIFMAIAKNIGHDKNGKPTYKFNPDTSYSVDSNGEKILDDETPEIAKNFNHFLTNNLEEETTLGFVVPTNSITENIYIPETYKPEIKQALSKIRKSKDFELIKVADLVDKSILQIKRGNEIGSKYYGTGEIPFVRTTDIVNWEIKTNKIKAVAEEIYLQYKKQQDIRENDILFVNDGTFLIGKSALVTSEDTKCIIQSHLRKIRVLKPDELNPFYLFYLLNSKIVQQQVEMLTFTQATLSTLGNRIMDFELPIHKDKTEIERISNEVQEIILLKKQLKQRTYNLVEGSL